MNAHRPFMLVGSRGPELLIPANDATRDESEGTDDIAPGAAIVVLAAMWLAEHWLAILLGVVAGMLGVAIPALVVARMLP
jgi:hypothetical protein